MKPIRRSIVEFSTKHSKWMILATVLVTLVAGAFFPKVILDTDPENMLESDEPARVFHNETKKRFNLSEVIVLGVINEHDPDGVFNPATLARVHALTEFARTLRWPDEKNPGRMTGVIEVDMIAPSMVDHMSQQGPGTITFEWLMNTPPKSREAARQIKEKALSNPLLKGQMVSEDGKALCIYLPLTDKLLSCRVYRTLRKKIDTLGGDDSYHIAGLPVAEGAIGVEMFSQMTTASPLAMAVICGLLLLFFRRWMLVMLPLIIATVSIVVTMGLMIACGYPVHILSSMLPIFLMSIAMVDSVHVLSEFFDGYTEEKGRRQSIVQVMDTLFAPMLYTSLTTAAGFLSLTLAPIPPARVFGVFLGIGVMIAWLVTVFFVPAYIMIIPKQKLKSFGLRAQEKEKQNSLTRALAFIGHLTHRHANKVLVIFAVLVVVSIWGITRIQVNDNYAKRFARNHPIREADGALNSHFGGTYMAYLVLENGEDEMAAASAIQRISDNLMRYGNNIADAYPAAPALAGKLSEKLALAAGEEKALAGVLDATIDYADKISMDSPDDGYEAMQELRAFLGVEKEKRKSFKQPATLAYMAGLQAHLERQGLIGKSNSVADVIRKVNQELIDGRVENFRIPDKLQGVSECYLQYQQSHRPHDLWHLVTPDYMQANIQMQFPTGDSMNTKATVEAVDAYFREHAPPTELTHRWAGLHYINLVLEARLVWGFLKSFAGSFLIVFAMMTYLFRSPLWGLLCMLPLTITLLMIYGITGLAGKDYDLPIAVLSALSIGMAVDFAIHFLERSRVAYQTLGSWKAVAPGMFGEPARAISRNVLVIAIGFLPLLVASLVPYKTTGVMLFVILSCSGLITLFVLPAVLKTWESRFFKSIKKETRGADRMDARGRTQRSLMVPGKIQKFWRRTASLTLFVSGSIVFISSLILYIGPPTHVAHFSDWRMLGLAKCQWNAIHIMTGLLFVIAMFLHIYFNWQMILAYLKNKRREMVLFTRPLVFSAAITAYVCAGTLWGLPPMGQIITWLRSIKIGHVHAYGTPPYGRAEHASLRSIAQYMGWDAEKCFINLREKGIKVTSVDHSITQIAKSNGISTGDILENMRNRKEREQ
jgi:predicted RND superfamily exporter protein